MSSKGRGNVGSVIVIPTYWADNRAEPHAPGAYDHSTPLNDPAPDLARCLAEGDEATLRLDLERRPIPGCTAESPLEEIAAALAGFGIRAERLELWGSGRPLREFLWSEDMADACVHIMNAVDFTDLRGSRPEVRNCHINIGSGKELTIRELAELVIRATGFGGELAFDASKPDGTMRKLTDVSKLHALGWTHSVEIDEGVPRLYRWYLDDLKTGSGR